MYNAKKRAEVEEVKKWTKKQILDDCVKYPTLTKWKKESSIVYLESKERGFFEDCREIMGRPKKHGFWTDDKIQAEANKYQTSGSWKKGSPNSYKMAIKRKGLKKYTKHMIKRKTSWTKKECIDQCLLYGGVTKWRENSRSVYKFAKSKGWLNSIKKKMGSKTRWTDELIQVEAFKYNTLREWRNKSRKSYAAAQSRKSLSKFSKHMVNDELIWTKEECVADALLYRTITEWKHKSCKCYGFALRNDYLDACKEAVGFNPVEKISTQEMKKLVNKIGRKSIPKYVFVRRVGSIVTIKNVDTDEQKQRPFSLFKKTTCADGIYNPWRQWGNPLSAKEIKIRVNEVGKKSNPPYRFIRDTGKRFNNQRLIEVQNIKTKELAIRTLGGFLNNKNPWRSRFNDSIFELQKRINEIGRKSDPKFRFICDTGKRREYQRIIRVENIKTKETADRLVQHFFTGSNPWTSIKIKEMDLKKRVNLIGKDCCPQFKFSKDLGTVNKKGKQIRYIEIENCETGEKASRSWGSVSSKCNPWNRKYDFHEKTVLHPKFKKLLEDLGFDVDCEVKIGIQSRVDFLIRKDNKVAIIEVKCDRGRGATWTKGSIDSQLNRYQKNGSLMYGDNLVKVIFCSPKGDQHGCISFSELKKELKELF